MPGHPTAPTPNDGVEFINRITSLIPLAAEIAEDPQMPEEARVLAAGVLPVLESLDYAPARAVQAEGGQQYAPAAAIVDVRSEEEPATFPRPPIWVN